LSSVVSTSLAQPSACIVLDLEGRICGWSHGAQCFFGRAASDALGRNATWLSGPHVLGDLEHACVGLELRATRPGRKADGTEVQLDMHITRVAPARRCPTTCNRGSSSPTW
jgi:hypothetical protein